MIKYRKVNSSSTIRDIQRLTSDNLYEQIDDPYSLNVRLDSDSDSDSESLSIIEHGSEDECLHNQIDFEKVMFNIERNSFGHISKKMFSQNLYKGMF